MTRLFSTCVFSLLCLSTPLIHSQSKPLQNEDIIKMVGVGLDEQLILRMIESPSCTFNVDAATVSKLKDMLVPDKVIEAMREKMAAVEALADTGIPKGESSSPDKKLDEALPATTRE